MLCGGIRAWGFQGRYLLCVWSGGARWVWWEWLGLVRGVGLGGSCRCSVGDRALCEFEYRGRWGLGAILGFQSWRWGKYWAVAARGMGVLVGVVWLA